MLLTHTHTTTYADPTQALGIASSAVVIVILSNSAMGSRRVHDELCHALSLKKKIVFIAVDATLDLRRFAFSFTRWRKNCYWRDEATAEWTSASENTTAEYANVTVDVKYEACDDEVKRVLHKAQEANDSRERRLITFEQVDEEGDLVTKIFSELATSADAERYAWSHCLESKYRMAAVAEAAAGWSDGDGGGGGWGGALNDLSSEDSHGWGGAEESQEDSVGAEAEREEEEGRGDVRAASASRSVTRSGRIDGS